MPKGRRSEKEIAEIKRFIVSLMLNRSSEINDSNDRPSPMKIVALCKDELNERVNEHTIAKYLKSPDLMSYSHLAKPQHNERLKDLDKRISLAKKMSEDESIKDKDRIMALNSYGRLFSEKSKYEKQLKDDRVQRAEVSKPIFLNAWQTTNAVMICPKCGEKFIWDSKDKKYKSDDEKGEGKDEGRKNLKAGSGQSTL